MLHLIGDAPDAIEEALRAAGVHAAREARKDPAETKDLAALLAGMIAGTELRPYFAARPGRVVFTEQEFCDASGRLLRMDRVVLDPDGVTVIDWKTGSEDPGEHEAQIFDYARVLSSVFPGKPVGALLAYVDLGIVRRVS
jgi:RecB family exonuclease